MAFFVSPGMKNYASAVKIIPSFNEKMSNGHGSGFLVLIENVFFILTARHVIDPRYRPQNRGWRDEHLTSAMAHIFYSNFGEGWRESFNILEVSLRGRKVFYCEADNDLAAIALGSEDEVRDWLKGGAPFYTELHEIAEHVNLRNYLPGDQASIVGYPALSPLVSDSDFIAEVSGLTWPIYRQGPISVPLIRGFRINGLLGDDYAFVDIYSLSGFSGGPVFALQRGLNEGPIRSSDFRSLKLIGINCGHLDNVALRASGTHAGLSYFVRCSAILNLAERLSDWCKNLKSSQKFKPEEWEHPQWMAYIKDIPEDGEG